MREDHDDLHGNPAVKQALQSARERMEQDRNEALEQLRSAEIGLLHGKKCSR